MITPPFLKSGDKVAIVAPAKRLQSGIEKAIEVLESWGLECQLGTHLQKQSNLFAGTDVERQQDLQQALDDPEIKAILMARGGYGTTRILDELDFTAFNKSPKWVCGFSDVTALLQGLVNLKVACVHSTVPVLMGRPDHQKSDESLRHAIFGDGLSYTFDTNARNRQGTATGQVCGGNVSMICNSIGTTSEIDTTHKILFIEDVGEYLYHLDRMLVQLKRAGKFEQLNGLIIGDFSSMKDHQDTFGLETSEIIASQISGYDFPVAYGFSAGHSAPNLSLYFGLEAKLSVEKQKAQLDYKASKQSG